MEILPSSVAKKLLALKSGQILPGSKLSPKWRRRFLQEEIISLQRVGRTKTRLSLVSSERLLTFLRNQFGIKDLEAYVKMKEDKKATGREASEIATDTKLRYNRTFKGFLVNLLQPFKIKLNGKTIKIKSTPGAFTFIYDFESFKVGENVKIIGVENPESFRNIQRHLHLFPEGEKLFISRYPQNSDVLNWLQSIPNSYFHFGDLDLAGIAIFEYEYRKHLVERASLLIPANAQGLIDQKGSRKLYNTQYKRYSSLQSDVPEIQQLISSIHQAKKGLEQEVLVSSP